MPLEWIAFVVMAAVVALALAIDEKGHRARKRPGPPTPPDQPYEYVSREHQDRQP